jgi:demethylmenaquinone methyltransferase/2-methoxy-6-polyprenyl-1,4-benzoquinol methylase
MLEPAQVRSMFARIAGVYDLLNRVLSLGIDQRWRRALLERAGDVRGARVVDACCGTGDVALCFARAGASVVGVDFTPEMLTHAERKGRALNGRAPRPAFAHGDALRLPVRAGAADVCTVAFGIRNVADRRAALREMARVVRPGGRVLVLEFSMPPGRALGALYRFYFTRVLPFVGRLVSRDADAYSYLPRTVMAWPSPVEFQREMEAEGLVGCGHRLLTRGIACLHWGDVPGARA